MGIDFTPVDREKLEEAIEVAGAASGAADRESAMDNIGTAFGPDTSVQHFGSFTIRTHQFFSPPQGSAIQLAGPLTLHARKVYGAWL
jgi:hypothetical protein